MLSLTHGEMAFESWRFSKLQSKLHLVPECADENAFTSDPVAALAATDSATPL